MNNLARIMAVAQGAAMAGNPDIFKVARIAGEVFDPE